MKIGILLIIGYGITRKKTPAGDVADNFNVYGKLNFGVINKA